MRFRTGGWPRSRRAHGGNTGSFVLMSDAFLRCQTCSATHHVEKLTNLTAELEQFEERHQHGGRGSVSVEVVDGTGSRR